jgi:hypothetical protein
MNHPKIIWQLTKQTGKEWGSHKPVCRSRNFVLYNSVSWFNFDTACVYHWIIYWESE